MCIIREHRAVFVPIYARIGGYYMFKVINNEYIKSVFSSVFGYDIVKIHHILCISVNALFLQYFNVRRGDLTYKSYTAPCSRAPILSRIILYHVYTFVYTVASTLQNK